MALVNPSHSDRISFISNSDRYNDRNQISRSNYGHGSVMNQVQDVSRNEYQNNENRFLPRMNHFDRIAYAGNNERAYYDQNSEMGNFRGRSGRYIDSDNFSRNGFHEMGPAEFYDNGNGAINNCRHARSGSFSSRTDSSVEYMGNSDRHNAGNGTTRFVVKADPAQKKAVISSKNTAKTALPRKSPIEDIVIDLVDSNIGSKRKEKEKEKSAEENGMSFKKAAATRVALPVPAPPSSSLPSSRISLPPPPPPPPPSFPPPSVNTKKIAPTLNYTASTSSSSQSVKSYKSSVSSSSSSSSSSSDSSTSSSSSSSAASQVAQTSRPLSQTSPSKSTSSRHSSQSSSQTPQPRPLSLSSSSRTTPQSPPPKTTLHRPSSQSSSHSTPHSSSSKQKDVPFTDNFHDMTKDESEEESENELDRIKINKVLALIQTLSSLSDRQQMAEQLLEKFNVSHYVTSNGLIPTFLFYVQDDIFGATEITFLSSLCLPLFLVQLLTHSPDT